MGNPSNATANVNQPCNYLLDKAQYAVSYCRDRGIPNWVSWHLDSSWLGSAPRQNDFRADPTLPAGWYQVQGTDYQGSGFDRGHHTPSADRTNTIPDNSATFLMTNIMPQAPDNNQGPWEQLESYSRSLIPAGNELYIIMGGYGNGGTGSNGSANVIAGGKVAVPNVTFKVIIVLPVGNNDPARVTEQTRVIAVIMPNTQGIRNNDWRSYRVSVDQVEQLTGLDFFSNVPVGIQNVIEARVDNQ
jgi:endonuclease G